MKTIFSIFACLFALCSFSQPKQLGTDTIRINVTVAQAKTIVDTNVSYPDFIILDIRTPSEYGLQHIANAININYYDANFSSQLDALDHNKMYLLHCAGGSRSTPTFASMQTKHFREVYHMNQGINAWISAGYPTVSGYTSVPNLSETKPFELFYPNPANNFLNVNFESAGAGKLFFIDMQGKILKEEILDYGLQYFDISSIPKGMYIIKILSTEGVFTEKITIL